VELEVWPNFVEECARRGVPAAVINGRISGRSFARYRRLRGFFSRTFRRLSAAGVQNDTYAERLRDLGARPTVTGNLKFDAEITFDPDAAEREWRTLLGLGDAPVIVAGSTHDPEERILLEAYAQLKAVYPALRLVLAPRHRERLPEVVKVVDAAQMRCYKRSLLNPESSSDGVILLDTVGELARLYAAATVVFIGGTFCPRGGQNMLEPAALGKPIVSGPSLSNFEDVARALVKAGGMQVLDAPGGLGAALEKLIRDPEAAREAGRRAREVVAGGQGALEATLALIESNLLRRL
jgi:3-deoxy-D-manno-octulosonic-acid transferase